MARLFFALWPDPPARGALAGLAGEAARRWGGRPVAAARLHVTLVFLGEVEPVRIPALARAAGEAGGGDFALTLDRLGGFPRARVAWAGCSHPPQALLGLQSRLERKIREAGFAHDERRFTAHLTLARHVRAPGVPEPMDPVTWHVRAFSLVESVTDEATYRTLARWPLATEKT